MANLPIHLWPTFLYGPLLSYVISPWLLVHHFATLCNMDPLQSKMEFWLGCYPLLADISILWVVFLYEHFNHWEAVKWWICLRIRLTILHLVCKFPQHSDCSTTSQMSKCIPSNIPPARLMIVVSWQTILM